MVHKIEGGAEKGKTRTKNPPTARGAKEQLTFGSGVRARRMLAKLREPSGKSELCIYPED